MYRVFAAAITGSIALVVLAQAVDDLKMPAGRTPTLVPEIPAGDDPMDRKPDPAAGTPAAESPPRADKADDGTECRVRRADTDTGFVVVCEEGYGG